MQPKLAIPGSAATTSVRLAPIAALRCTWARQSDGTGALPRHRLALAALLIASGCGRGSSEHSTSSPHPTRSPTPAEPPSLSVSDAVLCIAGNGSAQCWGEREYGRLGDLDGRPLSGVRAVAVGEGPTCACMENGDVHCWGPHGFVDGEPFLTSRTHEALHCTDVFVGRMAVCAATEAGTLACWGWVERRAFERLYPGDHEIVGTTDVPGWGTSSLPWRETPRVASSVGRPATFALGARTACMIHAGSWSCTGRALDLAPFHDIDIFDFDRQVSARTALEFAELAPGARLLDVGDAGNGVAEACVSDGRSVECWVEERSDHCAQPSCRCDRSPGYVAPCDVPTSRAAPVAPIRALRVEGARACVLGEDGSLWCWSTTTPDAPQRMTTHVLAFDLAPRRTCVLGEDHATRCWANGDPPPGPITVEPQEWLSAPAR